MRRSPPVLALALLPFVPLTEASAARTTTHVDVAGEVVVVSCDAGPIKADYAAETASGVPLTDAYAVERHANEGLVRLMSQGGRRTKRYTVPRHLIHAIVRVKDDADILDRVDMVFTPKNVILVHTSTANAGIFTISDVYRLPYSRAGGVDGAPLRSDRDLLKRLALGLSVHRPGTAGCRSPGGRREPTTPLPHHSR